MKLEVGMYVRTKYGHIAKLIYIDYENEYYEFDKGIVWFYEYYKDMFGFKDEDLKQITKTSFNIIDLIELEDYVNGEEIIIKDDGNIVIVNSGNCFRNEEIKSIVTKEQFEQMSYKIGDDEK